MRRCSLNHKSGNCNQCNGTRKCPTCNGTGEHPKLEHFKCPTCSIKGNVLGMCPFYVEEKAIV